MEQLKEWFRESAWIYPEHDKEFMKKLEGNLRRVFGEHCVVWQNKSHLESGRYPQYLCSADLRGIGGDVCHFWRDGQTWWPMSGDYSLEDEDKAELVLRKTIREFRESKQGVAI